MEFGLPASDTERLRRIGELIRLAIRRTPIDQNTYAQTKWDVEILPPAPWQLVDDEIEKAILRHLSEADAATPKQIGDALDLSHSTLVRRLRKLRNAGLVIVSGSTRRARYRLSAPYPGQIKH